MDFAAASKRSIFSVVTGSHMYGLNRPDSDMDVRSVFVGHPEISEPSTVKSPDEDNLCIELREFVRQLKNGDFQKIEMLFSHRVLHQDPIFAPLYSMRHEFLSEAWRIKTLGYIKATLLNPNVKGSDWAHGLRAGYIADQILTFGQPFNPNNILPLHVRPIIKRLKQNKSSQEDVLVARQCLELLYTRIQKTKAPLLDIARVREAYYKVSSAFWSKEFETQRDAQAEP